MHSSFEAWAMFEKLTWERVLIVLIVLVAARLLAALVTRGVRYAAERAAPARRLSVLRWLPTARVAIGVAAVLLAIPVLVEPTARNVLAIAAASVVALAFAFKDYVSSLVAGVAATLEHAYQPGDWIEIDGVYGEVTAVNLRAVRLTTADANEVTIPHARLWSARLSNSTSGSRSLLCVASFYLHPDHDGAAVCQCLAGIAEQSTLRLEESKVNVVAVERPWGTQYRLKAYARESRTQFDFVTELTIRGKGALRALAVRFAQAPFAELGGR